MVLGAADGNVWMYVVQGITLAVLIWLTGVLKDVREKVKRRIPKPVDVEEDHWRNQQIQEKITSLRLNLRGAIRTYFSRFHNGEHYVEGSELLKKTRTHESVGEGMKYQAEEYKGMLVSTVPEEMELVRQKGPSFRPVREIAWSKFKWLCEIGGVHAVARCAVYRAGKTVGFVGVDFNSEECPENINAVCECAGRIAELI